MSARILHVLPSFDTGGLGTLALSLITHWPDREAEHVVVGPHYAKTSPDLLPDFLALKQVSLAKEVPRSLIGDPLVYVQKLGYVINSAGPFSAAIVYNLYDHVWTAMAIHRTHSRDCLLVVHVGTIPGEEQRPILEKMLSAQITERAVFVFPSLAVKTALAPLLRPNNVGPVVWNGVDLERYRPSPGDVSSPYRVGFVGRMTPGAKDFATLIRAVGLAQGREPLLELHLAGDGPSRREYRHLADAQPCPDRYHFHGMLKTSAMPAFLKSLDVFAMAALPIEGMSIALVEAIAAHCPIVATDVPANREVLAGPLAKQIYPQGIAWLAPAGDHAALALGLLQVTTQRALRERMAERTRLYSHHFSIVETARAYWALCVSTSLTITPTSAACSDACSPSSVTK